MDNYNYPTHEIMREYRNNNADKKAIKTLRKKRFEQMITKDYDLGSEAKFLERFRLLFLILRNLSLNRQNEN